MTSKEESHHLLDELPERELPAARWFLEFLRSRKDDPFLQALERAPEDEEQETPEEASAVRQAWRECLSGNSRPWEEVRRELAND